MARSVKQKYEFDARDGILSLDRLMQKFQAFGKASDSTRKTIDTLAHSAQALTGVFSAINFGVDRFSNVANAVIKANSEIEQLKTSLTGLISVSHSNVSSMGKMLNVQQKWVLSTKKAEETLQSLNKIASKTSFSLDQTSQMFKAFYSTASGNLSLKQSIEAFEGLANMASVVGINVEQMIRTLDGVGAGKWTSSELTRFLEGNLGLTKELAQEAIKSGKYYELLMDKLKEFNEISKFSANTYEASVARLKNEFNELAKVVGAPMFEGLKDSLNTTTKLLEENREAIAKVANFSIEAGKHLGFLAGAFVAVKASTLAYSAAMGGAKLISEGFGLITKANITSLSALNVALKGTSATFKTFLPTALVFGGFEILLRFFDDSKKGADALTESIKKTNEELSKLSQHERNRMINDINDRRRELDAKERELTTKLKTGSFFSPFPPQGKERTAILGDIKAIERKRLELDAEIRRIEKINEDALNSSKETANKFGDLIANLNDKYKNTTILADLKKELADVNADLENLNKEKAKNTQEELQQEETRQRLLKAREEITKKINNFNKEYVKGLDEIKSALKEINEVYFAEIEKNTQTVIDKYNKMIDLGISKKEAQKFLDANLSKISQEHLKRAEENEKEIINKQLDLRSEYYKTIGEYEEAWQIEKAKLEEKYQKLIFENGEKLTTEQFKKLLEIEKKKFLAPFVKNANSAFKDIKGSWADTVSTMSKTVEDGFFNLFMRKTKDLKSALKDIGQGLFRDMISPYARSLSQGLSGSFGALLGGGSNLASIASNLGLAKNDSGGWIGSVSGTTVELSSTGQILRGADALDKGTTNLLGSISNLKTAYSAFTGLFEGGYSGFVSNLTSNPALAAKGWLNGLGYSKLGTAVYDFGAGAQGVLTNSSMPAYFSTGGTVSPSYVAGGAFAGAGIGYAAGTLGDWLTGTQTKAGLGGAIGGGIGGGLASAGLISNPVGWVIAAVGLVIGSFISKAKQTDAGLFLRAAIGAALDEKIDTGDIQKYTEKTKKNWWRKKVSWEYDALDAKTAALLEQSTKAVQMSLRGISATNGLVLSAGHFSANSFLNENLALGALSSFTGLARNIALEDSHRATIKKWNLSNIFVGPGSKKIFDKAGKLISNTLGDKAEKLLRKGALIGGYGMAPQLGLINKTDDIAKTPAQIEAENARLVEMRKSFEAYAKEQKKQVLEVIVESLNTVNQSVIDIELSDLKNPILKAAVSVEKAIDAFSLATDNSFGEIGDILQVSAESFKNKYLEALRSDFTKENVDKWNAAKIAFDAARKAQEDYTKAVISFTQQIAGIQAGFYGANKIDTTFLGLQSIYRRFNTLLGGLNYDISDNQRKEVAKFGSATDIHSWSKYLLSLSSDQMQVFLSEGNTELRQELVKVLTEHKQAIDASGGKEGWIKSLVELEALNKQIAGLKLAEQAEKTLQLQREQLNVLNLQKNVIEKLGGIAQRIRDNVIDHKTSGINYQFALERARVAWNNKDYSSKAFDNLSNAANHQQQYFKDTAKTYEEYKLNMLKMAGEIEAISDRTTLDDINKSIKKLEDLLNIGNKTIENQLAALEAQRQQLIQNSKNEISELDRLLGNSSPMVRYLRDVLTSLSKDANGNTPKLPDYSSGKSQVDNRITTANGALLLSDLDKQINQTYLSSLGRSVEQSGLEFWRNKINAGQMSITQLAGELIKSAIAITGSNNKSDWIEWYKSKGFKPFADGGIVTRPTAALIGEAGYPEAVLPLDGRTLKVDTDNKELERLLREIVYLLKTQGKDMKELNLSFQNVTDGDKLFTKAM
ncbi:hypothetical protein [Campylobacter sp. RM16190]|uniref:hypothetical protein n=1 Tax=Campylobacter sp. RM16190 TaxID=1705727 RepID=UPI0014732AC2|nr:hypothetical protein [Campylobacter sp. RM16190]